MVNLAAVEAPLFVPANRPERFLKAAESSADAIILDLEDAVPGELKDFARSALQDDFANVPVLVRINGYGTKWHAADLAAVRYRRFAGIVVPKAESPVVLAEIANFTGCPVVALIESAKGIAVVRAMSEVAEVERLAFGSIDFCSDLGCAHERAVLLPFRSELVLASRLAGIAPPIDGVTVQLKELAVTHDDAVHARSLGMGGKLCIHPKQVVEVQRAFTPTKAELQWAEKVLASGEGAVSIDGTMVDEPVRIRARALLFHTQKHS